MNRFSSFLCGELIKPLYLEKCGLDKSSPYKKKGACPLYYFIDLPVN
jgi:hypothetical protein